jgi:NAD(P)-dependent dehydrogenase (short-subunit alcohol dehydrogenase family)
MLPTAVLVTGASRGFGRCLTLDFARLLQHHDIDLVRGHSCPELQHRKPVIDHD